MNESGINYKIIDFEPHPEDFYRRCGFRDTSAGLMNLKEAKEISAKPETTD